MTNMIVACLVVAMVVSPTLCFRYRYPSQRQEVENEWFQTEGEEADNEWFQTPKRPGEGIVTSLTSIEVHY